MKSINVVRVHPDAKLPTRAKPGDSGLDLYAIIQDGDCRLSPGDRHLVRTGIAIELEPGYEAQVRPRSGLASKAGVQAAFGTIDSGYRGEILVSLFNHSYSGYTIRNGDRIAQLVIAPVAYPEPVEVSELSASERGVGGFGSTGA